MADIKPVQTIFAEKEVQIIKKNFAGNDTLLKAIRALLQGFDITPTERDLIKSVFKDKEVLRVFKGKVYPEFERDDTLPIGSIRDFWSGTENNIFGGSRDMISQTIESKRILLGLLKVAMESLVNPDGNKVNLNFDGTYQLDPLQTFLLARNLYLRTIETALDFVNKIANQSSESPSQTKTRLNKNSVK
jgi:hypothetical protein